MKYKHAAWAALAAGALLLAGGCAPSGEQNPAANAPADGTPSPRAGSPVTPGTGGIGSSQALPAPPGFKPQGK